MNRLDFHYELPPELIASGPVSPRSASRLLHLDIATAATTRHRRFYELPDLLQPGDHLVFNDTKVIRARLYGRKSTGGAVEILIERVLDAQRALAQARASKPIRPGALIEIASGLHLEVEAHEANGCYRLRCPPGFDMMQITELQGHVPLPPYIDRPDTPTDVERYQNVFARVAGAVAAPTAGLHFDLELLDRLRSRGISMSFVTLHVGAGTFASMRAQRIEDHRMHTERMEVSAATCAAINTTRAAGGRIFAVGTTVVRALESAASAGALAPMNGETDIFISPGYRFRVVDAIITNFHLPESTLLVLVAAYAGRRRILAAYAEAIAQRYRFFSYGDAMLLSGGALNAAPNE